MTTFILFMLLQQGVPTHKLNLYFIVTTRDLFYTVHTVNVNFALP